MLLIHDSEGVWNTSTFCDPVFIIHLLHRLSELARRNACWCVLQAWYFLAILLKSGKVTFSINKNILRVETTSDALTYA